MLANHLVHRLLPSSGITLAEDHERELAPPPPARHERLQGPAAQHVVAGQDFSSHPVLCRSVEDGGFGFGPQQRLREQTADAEEEPSVPRCGGLPRLQRTAGALQPGTQKGAVQPPSAPKQASARARAFCLAACEAPSSSGSCSRTGPGGAGGCHTCGLKPAVRATNDTTCVREIPRREPSRLRSPRRPGT